MSTEKNKMFPSNNDTLGAELIESAIGLQDALASLIEAETLKVATAKKIAGDVGGLEAIEALTNLDNSVANVLSQICCIEGELNDKIQAGLTLRGF
jgi:division protein CdvB (Snf7/Vps24/ESCRT-III family)